MNWMAKNGLPSVFSMDQNAPEGCDALFFALEAIHKQSGSRSSTRRAVQARSHARLLRFGRIASSLVIRGWVGMTSLSR